MLARPELDAVGHVLIHAAEAIEKDGWWCGSRTASRGDCLMTAIWIQKDAGNQQEAADRVVSYLGLKDRKEAVKWNDAPGRTKEQVVAALRGAAYLPAIKDT